MRSKGSRTEIAPALAGLDPFDQGAIDARLIALDGTPNKARLGGNALTAVSLAVLHAAAASRGLPLWRYCLGDRPAIVPLPEIQIFGGGAHAGRRTDVQDFMVVAPRAKTFAEALAVTAEVYHAAGAIMAERGLLQGVADEGGWWPAFSTNEEALETLMRAIERAGLAPGDGRGDIARRRRVGIRPRRPLSSGARKARARPRRTGRNAARLVRPLSDPVDRGPVRRGRRSGVRAIHRRGRRPHPGDRRRLSRHQRKPRARGARAGEASTRFSSRSIRRER